MQLETRGPQQSSLRVCLGRRLGLLVCAGAERLDGCGALRRREPRARGRRLARVASLVRGRRARTAWHRHPGAQILFVEKGRARVQERGGSLHELATGETFYTAPNVEHWHGATPDSEFTQGALTHGDSAGTVWLEQVSDAQYAGR